MNKDSPSPPYLRRSKHARNERNITERTLGTYKVRHMEVRKLMQGKPGKQQLQSNYQKLDSKNNTIWICQAFLRIYHQISFYMENMKTTRTIVIMTFVIYDEPYGMNNNQQGGRRGGGVTTITVVYCSHNQYVPPPSEKRLRNCQARNSCFITIKNSER